MQLLLNHYIISDIIPTIIQKNKEYNIKKKNCKIRLKLLRNKWVWNLYVYD